MFVCGSVTGCASGSVVVCETARIRDRVCGMTVCESVRLREAVRVSVCIGENQVRPPGASLRAGRGRGM